jgi:hypothetical protein
LLSTDARVCHSAAVRFTCRNQLYPRNATSICRASCPERRGISGNATLPPGREP